MSNEGQHPENEGASFADLLAAQEEEQQGSQKLEPGQRVKATVVAIDSDTVFVSTGTKVDGLVERSELEQDGVTTCDIGDVLDLYVVHVSPHEVRLSKVVRGAGGLAALEDAKDAGLPVEGKVSGQVKGGFSVDLMKRRAFCPASQMDLRQSDKPEEYVGKTLSFLITKLEKGGRNIVLSRRSLLEAANAEAKKNFLESVKEGDVLEGEVTRITPFGAFVEIAPGVEGLVHLSELSWSRVQQADELLSVGDKIRVKFISVAPDKKGEDRITLSIRQITEDPWNSVADRVNVGDILSGKVVRLASFGAFVEILPGIEGMVHLSEMSWEKRINKASEVVSVGDTVSVKVKEFDAEKRRVSLSLRDAEGDPWGSVESDFAIGGEYAGKVERRAPFGLFIAVAPGVTGLLPNALLNGVKGKSKYDKLNPGDEVTVRVHELDLANRKITLIPGGEDGEAAEKVAHERAADGKGPRGQRRDSSRSRGPREDGEWKQHANSGGGSGGFGSLASALSEAMKKKGK